MARMYGMSGGRRFTCGCCDWWKGKRAIRAKEDRRWQTEADEEMAEDAHELVPVDGYCCISCKEEYGGYLGTPDDLQNVEGVTYYGTQRRNQ